VTNTRAQRKTFATKPPSSSEVASKKSSKSSSKSEELPPLPVSPLKAKQRYLESKKNLDSAKSDLSDVNARILQLNKELDGVRERNAKLLDKELNKPAWRKLVDPLKRYRHSLYNVLAISLAYVLAHKLFMARKEEKQASASLAEAVEEQTKLKHLLSSLMDDDSVSKIASECLEAIGSDGGDGQSAAVVGSNKSGGWFFGSKPSHGGLQTGNGYLADLERQEVLQQKLIPIIRQELQDMIGDAALSENELKEKMMQEVIEEGKAQVEELSDNPEKLLREVLAGGDAGVEGVADGANPSSSLNVVSSETDAQGNKVVKKRVFSM